MAKILLSPLSWGLGHATRDIPVIKELLRHGHTVGIAATGIALEFLTMEFPDLAFYDVPDYPSPYTGGGFSVPRVVALFPLMTRNILREHRAVTRIVMQEKYDMVISDNRFGAYVESIPSLFISHQIRYSTPGGLEPVERITEVINERYHKHFERVIIPDNPPGPFSLSGKLGYARRPATRRRAYYAGILTDMTKRDLSSDFDYLIAVSGPKVTKGSLKQVIIKQAEGLNGTKVIVLGDPADSTVERIDRDTMLFGHASRQQMEEFLNRAKFVITRSGYTTVMELSELGKKDVLFIPTPGQTEQEYLSTYYEQKGWVHSVAQKDINLVRDVEKARLMLGLPRMSGAEQNVRRLYESVIEGFLSKYPATA